MNAFSFKVLYLDAEFDGTTFNTDQCSPFQSWFLAFKNGTYGVPPDGNFAIDINNHAFTSFNPNINFFTQCDVFTGNYPDNTCPDSEIRLEGTEFDFATRWIPIGTKAMPREVFELQLMTFDQTNQNVDTTVLLDDFKLMSEDRRTHSNSQYITNAYGYQYTGDIALVALTPDVKGLYPAGTKSITLSFVIRCEGPEICGDVTVSFTPPFGTKLNTVAGFVLDATFLASGDFVDNSFYKFKLSDNAPLLPHQTVSGSITYDVLDKVPKDVQFRVTATTSSIDYVWGNNHLVQLVYSVLILTEMDLITILLSEDIKIVVIRY